MPGGGGLSSWAEGAYVCMCLAHTLIPLSAVFLCMTSQENQAFGATADYNSHLCRRIQHFKQVPDSLSWVKKRSCEGAILPAKGGLGSPFLISAGGTNWSGTQTWTSTAPSPRKHSCLGGGDSVHELSSWPPPPQDLQSRRWKSDTGIGAAALTPLLLDFRPGWDESCGWWWWRDLKNNPFHFHVALPRVCPLPF